MINIGGIGNNSFGYSANPFLNSETSSSQNIKKAQMGIFNIGKPQGSQETGASAFMASVPTPAGVGGNLDLMG